ncbi:AraC family transcriptional regulator [Azorhizobium oxalatiphilum]|nr:helix-turn-helix transcriptional regulator [Azorhizobium oxalatiphilum]
MKRTSGNTPPAPIVELETDGRPVHVRPMDFAKGTVIDPHRHRRGQLIYATSGLFVVRTPAGIWMVPSLRGVWVPPMTEHAVSLLTDTRMRSAYIAPEACGVLGQTCRVISVPSVLRELIIYLGDSRSPHDADFHQSIAVVMTGLIREVSTASLSVPLPENDGLRQIYRALTEDPSDQRTLKDWARAVGGSERTLLRRLKDETGMSFRQWRQQIRLLCSLERLASGQPVTTVALDVGYETASGFITAFRQTFGATPAAYFES